MKYITMKDCFAALMFETGLRKTKMLGDTGTSFIKTI